MRLAIEPLHPMMISERAVIVTLGEENDMAERFDAHRVVVVWWDGGLRRRSRACESFVAAG